MTTMSPETRNRGTIPYWPLIEATICLLYLLLQAINTYTQAIPLNWTIRINTLFLICLLLTAWKRFDGGMHICFLFLGTQFLFMAGALLVFTFNPLFGNDPMWMDPFRFKMMVEWPFDVGDNIAELTMLAVVSSAVFVYLPCSIRYAPARLPDRPSPAFMRALFRIYFFSFPFLIYKNLVWLLFIRNHGGYMALYTMGDQFSSTVGPIPEFISLVAALAFLVIFIFETDRMRTYILTSSFLVAYALALIIGLRGKVFTFLLTLWFLQLMKRRKHFSLLKVASIVIPMAFLALFIDSYRGSQDIARAGIPSNPLAFFVAGQGGSMQVVEAVIGFKHEFVHNPFKYLLYEMKPPLFPSPSQTERPTGQYLADDLGYYLNREAALLGNGTGSSYLAEAYLFGGFWGVIIISGLLGYLLSRLHFASKSLLGALVLAYTMPSIIYMPRTVLLDPVAQAMKLMVAIFLLIPVLYIAMKIPRLYLLKGSTKRPPCSVPSSGHYSLQQDNPT